MTKQRWASLKKQGRIMRTIIIGNSGSGKTWLANKLANSNHQIIHLDNIFWMPGGFDVKRTKEEVEIMISNSKLADNWICEGVFGELAKQYFDAAQTLLWLNIDWEICKYRLEIRGFESKQHLGREQSSNGLIKLIDWASLYYQRTDLRSLTGHERLYNEFHGNKLILTSEHHVNEYVKYAQTLKGVPEARNEPFDCTHG